MNAPAELSAEVLAQRQREVVQALMAVLPNHCLLYRDEDTVAYDCDGLAAYRRLPLAVALPGDRVASPAHRADLPSSRRADRAARRGNRPVRRRDADSPRRRRCRSRASGRSSKSTLYARTATVQPGVRNLSISEAAAPVRLVLRAGPVVADCLHDRRQRLEELGRRALPQVRPHRAQRAARARRDDGRRDRRIRFARARRARPRSARRC